MRSPRVGWISFLIVVVGSALAAQCALADTEPNNLRHRPEVVQPGTHAGLVGGADATDWYRFAVTGGDIIRVTVDETTGADVSVKLRDHEDSYLEDCKRGRTLTYLTAFELGQRNWYLKVEGEGSYRFTLELARQNDGGTGQDAPEAFRAAVPIAGGVHRGMLSDDDEKDVFKFPAVAGQIVTIELQADFSRFDREMDSVELQLRSPDDSHLENVHSYGDKETLTYGPLGEDEAGEMRMVVSGEGDYEFSVPLLGPGATTVGGPSDVQPTPTGEPQTIQFGGAGRFRFFFPVSAQGNIEARIQWEPQVAAEVMLFSPAKKMPVARTRGAGSAVLTYGATSGPVPILRDIPILQKWAPRVAPQVAPSAARAGEWMIQVVPQPPDTVIQGSATIQFPGSDAGRVQWRPYQPRTTFGKAALASYLRAVDRVAAGQTPANRLELRIKDRMGKDPQYAADVKTAARAYTVMPQAQRLEVVGAPSLAAAGGTEVTAGALDTTAALQAQGTTMADAAQQALQLGAQPALEPVLTPVNPASFEATVADAANIPPPRLKIRFNYIYCFDETSWDGLSDSDEIYYLVGIIGPDGQARGFVSDVFGDFDDGEGRPSTGVPAYDVIWEGEITGDTYCVVMLMEQDYSSRQTILNRFLSCLEDTYADISNLPDGALQAWGTAVGAWGAGAGALGGAALAGPVGAAIGAALGALVGWIISGLADDVLGDPEVIHITPEKAAAWTRGPGYVWDPDFRGDGAHYGFMFTLGRRVTMGD